MQLTLSYCLLLALTLGLLGGGLFVILRNSMYGAVDDDLRLRLQGVTRLMERQIPRLSGEDLTEEFREHSGLRPGGDMLEVWDSRGVLVFQSASMRDYNIPIPARRDLFFDNLVVRDRPLRMLMATVPVAGKTYSVLLATPVGNAQEVVRRLGLLLFWAIPAALLVAAIGGYWMSRKALAPVDEITQAARLIGAQNLSQRLTVPRTGDELQRLSETLNEMMERLQSSFERVMQFTADASHELRTPIALIRTAAELALRRRRDEGNYRDALQHILEEAERTSSLIESLTVLARADSESDTLPRSATDIGKVLESACDQGKTLAYAKHVEFSQNISPDVPLLMANPQSLHRLFLILIDNAVKYTPPGGAIAARLSCDLESAVVSVEDSGIGISPEDLPHVFERFYRADKARTRDIGGTGLGLSIAKWIADAHQAVLSVKSTPDRGSTFRVTFALEKRHERKQSYETEDGASDRHITGRGRRVGNAGDATHDR
jgi:heavy metal sensor kinase